MRLTLNKTATRGICFLSRPRIAAIGRTRKHPVVLTCLAVVATFGLQACDDSTLTAGADQAPSRPSILLVTLDTSRADAFGFEGGPADTPALDQLASESTVLRGYATAPMTLPSHTSMMTGLYPAQHGIHENARRLDDAIPLLAEQLESKGYQTAAFVSAVPLDGGFGLSRGFAMYDDQFGNRGERSASETNEVAVRFLQGLGPESTRTPIFLWVHYFDPHAPYVAGHASGDGQASSEDLDDYGALGADTAGRYLHEIETVDRAFEELISVARNALGADLHILVVGDHGESLGEHGERTHGNLLFEPVLRVPMIAHEPGRAPDRPVHPVSVRRVHGTVLHWADATAGSETAPTVFDRAEIPVLAEAMQPFLQYGWQPHVAAVAAEDKALLFGSDEFGASLLGFDLQQDPNEEQPRADVPAELRAALRAYAIPTSTDAKEALDPQMSGRLAELGYLTGGGSGARLRADAPRAIDQTHLFDALDRASSAFERGDYEAAIHPLLEVVRADPGNFAAVLRLAVVYSLRGDPAAETWFARAREIAPDSADLQHYEGMHRLSRGDLAAAATLFEAVLRRQPDRATTLRAYARVASGRGDQLAALDALSRLVALDPEPDDLRDLGRLAMNRGRTEEALSAFERARALDPDGFDAALELGVLLIESRRFEEARDMLELELANDSDARGARHAMALFKRAQVAVLLEEADADDRIQAATDGADASTAPLIATERLFQGRPDRGVR